MPAGNTGKTLARIPEVTNNDCLKPENDIILPVERFMLIHRIHESSGS